jgi:alkylhydroperoxidase/carboxymuconolactone decarboxylase family protein YurZ
MSKTAKETKEARKQDLLARHNRKAMETGLRLQGEFFLRQLDEHDQLDPEWTERYITWIYDYLYNRQVLDDKTRVLVIVGECCVLDEQTQLPNHMRSALRCGATPAEILEVIIQSAVYGGMPKMVKAVRTYRALMKDLGLVNVEDSEFRIDARD